MASIYVQLLGRDTHISLTYRKLEFEYEACKQIQRNADKIKPIMLI